MDSDFHIGIAALGGLAQQLDSLREKLLKEHQAEVDLLRRENAILRTALSQTSSYAASKEPTTSSQPVASTNALLGVLNHEIASQEEGAKGTANEQEDPGAKEQPKAACLERQASPTSSATPTSGASHRSQSPEEQTHSTKATTQTASDVMMSVFSDDSQKKHVTFRKSSTEIMHVMPTCSTPRESLLSVGSSVDLIHSNRSSMAMMDSNSSMDLCNSLHANQDPHLPHQQHDQRESLDKFDDNEDESAESGYLKRLQHALRTQDDNVLNEASMLRKPITLREVWSQHTALSLVPLSDITEPVSLVTSIPDSEKSLISLTFGPRASSMAVKSFCRKCPVLHPSSMKRLVWIMLSLILLGYDLVMVPVSLCFRLNHDHVAEITNWIWSCFWTLDIVLTFFTGVFYGGKFFYRVQNIAFVYAKTWLGLDIILTGTDWFMLYLDVDGIEEDSPLRILRLLRFLRIVRVMKLKPFLEEIVMRSSSGLHVTGLSVVVTFALIMGAHFFACVWHLIGYEIDKGWVHANDMASMSVLERYIVAMRWSVGRLQGTSPNLELHTTLELTIESLYLFTCLIVVSIYVGIVTHTMIVNANAHSYKLRITAMQFVKHHDICRTAYLRMLRHLSASNYATGQAELLRSEAALLEALPQVLREDLQHESRLPNIIPFAFLREVDTIVPRVVRHLCYEAVSDLFAPGGEVVFSMGDVCDRMLFVAEGEFKYLQAQQPSSSGRGKSRGAGRSSTLSPIVVPVLPRDMLSEIAVWVYWEHSGDLVASEDSTCLALDAIKFGDVITQYFAACVFAVKYARACVHHLESEMGPSSDIATFESNLSALDDFETVTEKTDHHVVFISHYKQEAGTEAALMRHALKELITVDLECPVFVDSEDLADLAALQRHVEISDALMVLLTPGLLGRPWCVLEIVTAVRHNVQIVPVEVQRPGMEFEFPNDSFYFRLHKGEILDRSALRLLKKAGVSMQDVDAAIRKMFMKIALPYSPHKSDTIRGAELLDILKRIPVASWEAAPGATSHVSSPSFSPHRRSSASAMVTAMTEPAARKEQRLHSGGGPARREEACRTAPASGRR